MLHLDFNPSAFSPVINFNSASCTKLQEVMEQGAKLMIRAYTNREGYPTFWIESIQPHKTDEFSISAYNEILNKVYNYLRTGKAQEIVFSEKEYQNSETEDNFSMELFKTEIENGIRVNTQSAFRGAKYFKAFTNHKKGQIHYNFEMTEKLEAYLIEKNLI